MQLKLPIRKQHLTDVDRRHVRNAAEYIHTYWQQLIRHQAEDSGTLIGLPHPYVVPAFNTGAEFNFEEQFYWDSYFTSLGLMDASHQNLVEGMLENIIYLLHRFGLVPNASRMYFTSRSQPPILTSYILEVYQRYNKSHEWLSQKMSSAQHEYQNVWMADKHPQWHHVYQGLSRYYDINVLHDLAEAESGWDMTPRFERKCLDYLPVDLNALLYKYETDFASTAAILGNLDESKHWQERAEHRKHTMNKLMWSKSKGFFFDYNYNKGERGSIWSLAGYYPMWAGMVDQHQAQQLADNIDKFEKSGGLSTTTRPLIDTSIFGSLKTQWAYPNGWAPLHYIVTEGLKRYGFLEQAERIQRKWLKTNTDWFNKHHAFLEKYNVVSPHKYPVEGVYPSQTGFGWTNAVYVRFATDLGLL